MLTLVATTVLVPAAAALNSHFTIDIRCFHEITVQHLGTTYVKRKKQFHYQFDMNLSGGSNNIQHHNYYIQHANNTQKSLIRNVNTL